MTATIALFLCCLISLAVAQGPGGAPAAAPSAAGPRIALLDVTYIFKNHERFKAQMEEMKRDVQAAEKKFQAERAAINKMISEALPQYNKGTPEYQAKEEEITNRQAKLALDVNRQKEIFRQQEAQIYSGVYQEIRKSTDYFCKQHGIDMVLNINSDLYDPKYPESVVDDIRKQVIWYDARWVITKFILDDLNRTPLNQTQGTQAKRADPYGTTR
jgi:Skp family chaperone for outer membrane proteins